MKCPRQVLVAILAIGGPAIAWGHSDATSPSVAAPFGAPVDDQRIYAHALLDEFEYRAAGSDSVSRWEGEAWMGTDTNRLWMKSEGDLNPHGDATDGQQEVLYDRPISSFFDLQAGVRYDLDSSSGRAWGAFGVEGLAPYFVHVSATVYASDAGHFAAKAQGSYDVLLTQHLLLQPQIEANAYSRDDLRRQLGSGLSDVDAGLRLRYEFTRKFAPYVGISYQRTFAGTARFTRAGGGTVEAFSFLVGIHGWF